MHEALAGGLVAAPAAVDGAMIWASLAVLAALVIGFAALSGSLERWLVSPAMFFVATGLVAGSAGLGWLQLQATSETVRALAEATLVLVLFADAARIDLAALRQGIAVPARLLGIGLPLTIVAGTLVGLGILPGLTVAEALVLAIVLAPTHAALGQAVVTDRRLPAAIRQGLNVESGLNDGICVPLLFIALAVAEAESAGGSTPHALQLVVQEIGWGLAGGAIAGGAGAIAARVATGGGLGDPSWRPVIPVATALLAYALAIVLGGSGFIAAFVGGRVIEPDGRFIVARRPPALVPGELDPAREWAAALAAVAAPLAAATTIAATPV